MESEKRKRSLQNETVDIKVKLALMWVALMFLYLYNDIFSLFQPGHIVDLADGHLEGVHFTQTLLFSASVLMALPSLMVLLTLSAGAKANRIINISAGFFHILVLVATQFVGDSASWFYWRFYELLEALILLMIIRSSWKWPSAQLL